MNLDNVIVHATLFAQAAQRLYKIAYMLPAPSEAPRNQAYSIKLPVPTVITNAKLLCDLIQLTPTSHRTTYMGQIFPLLQYLIGIWEKLHKFTTLETLQANQSAMHALRQVTLLLHSIYPTVGMPGERVTHPGFSLGMSSDTMVMEKTLVLTTKFKLAARHNANQLYKVSTKYDLAVAENLNRLDPFATWDMANPNVFADEPKLSFIPCHLEKLQNPHYSLAGNVKTIGLISKGTL